MKLIYEGGDQVELGSRNECNRGRVSVGGTVALGEECENEEMDPKISKTTVKTKSITGGAEKVNSKPE